MSTTTPDPIGIAVPDEHRPSPSGRLRFAVAFIVGLLLATVAGAGPKSIAEVNRNVSDIDACTGTPGTRSDSRAVM